ncbi:MAG: hypothetical protein IIU75_04855 [Rikenellaceae bacterium]|nr:hypothetical protein [Rikenellaceae bacterium]
MEITVKRFKLTKRCSIGNMLIDGKFFCNTLEDKVRKLPDEAKVWGKTAIPAGTYKIEMYDSPRFKRRLPLLKDVPYFTGILIHRGNTVEDTVGCILVGEANGEQVWNSTPYEKELCRRIDEATARGEEITITITQ